MDMHTFYRRAMIVTIRIVIHQSITLRALIKVHFVAFFWTSRPFGKLLTIRGGSARKIFFCKFIKRMIINIKKTFDWFINRLVEFTNVLSILKWFVILTKNIRLLEINFFFVKMTNVILWVAMVLLDRSFFQLFYNNNFYFVVHPLQTKVKYLPGSVWLIVCMFVIKCRYVYMCMCMCMCTSTIYLFKYLFNN
jgi:hypothetical protein